MKTAMQDMLEWIELRFNNPQETEVFKKATELLEKEKEQIMTANIEGTEHWYRERALFGLDARTYSKKRAEQYYNQTYNQNQ